MAPTDQVAVVGIGNLLLMDEGVGVHAVRELERSRHPVPVRLIDGGTDPWTAFARAESCRALVLLDAVVGGKRPGALHRLSLEDVETNTVMMSLHGVSLFHLVRYEALLGNAFDEVRVLGMEPDVVEPGIGLSERCRQELPALVKMAREEIAELQARLVAQ